MVRSLQVFMCSSFLWASCVWSVTTARFNRDTIRLNETVELIIESDQTAISHGVDYSAIEKQFRIVSQRRDTNVTVMNGQSQLVHRWRTELAPLSVGSFGVGPVTVDQEQTNRLRLTVLPQADEASINEEVFIEIEIDKDTVYVQQQVLFTANLYISVRLLDGSLVDPAPANTLVRRLGKDIRYETKRGEKSYAVFKRRYALIPQKSGELIVPAVQFEGLADDAGGANSGVFSPLFSQGRRIYANGKAIRINVKPPPAEFTGKNWLPSESVTISEDTGATDNIEVGQPITRKIRLQGVNVTAEQLPEPVIGVVDGVRSYPDQSRLATEDTETGVVGTVSIDIAMIGSRAGEITLPEISVPWWNITTDQMETAVLPARVIRIIENALSSANGTPGEPSGESVAEVKSKLPQLPTTLATNARPNGGIWKWLTIIMVTIWLITAGILLKLLRKKSLTHSADNANDVRVKNLAGHYKQVRNACSENDALATRNALNNWARARFGYTVSLPQIADLLAIKGEYTNQFRLELQKLDKNLFSPASSTDWSGGAMWRVFEQIQAQSSVGSAKHKATLPRLYPAS